MPDVNLLVVDNALYHDIYRPVEHWAEMAGFEPDSVHVPSGESLPDVDLYSHVIITGCEGSITDLPAWAESEALWLKEVIAAGKAVLGSCWGHQLIAVVFAGLEAVRRATVPEQGWIEISVKNPAELLPPKSFQTFAAHFDEVIAGCHPELRVLASTGNCAVQAARWGDRPVWGIQPHPEITPECGTEFLQKCMTKWPDSEGLYRSALAGPILDSGAGAEITKRFLQTGF